MLFSCHFHFGKYILLVNTNSVKGVFTKAKTRIRKLSCKPSSLGIEYPDNVITIYTVLLLSRLTRPITLNRKFIFSL